MSFSPTGWKHSAFPVRPAWRTASRAIAPETPTVVVKLGEHGAYLRGRRFRISLYGSAPMVEVVDTTGAGDTFNAGFLYGYLQGWEAEDSLRLALACGSLSTRSVGGTSAQPTLEEAMVLAETVQNRSAVVGFSGEADMAGSAASGTE